MKEFKNGMQPIFCIDVTTNKNNTSPNGSEFITRTASQKKIEEYDNKRENLNQTIEKSRLPLSFQIIKLLCGFFSITVLFSCIGAGFERALKNAPVLIILGAICGVLWVVLHFIAKGKEKTVLKEEQADYQLETLNQDLSSIYNELGVPEDAVEIDVLAFKYKLKNGEIRPYAHGLQTTPYFNVCFKIYATPEELHVVDVESVYSFKKTEIKSIITVNKRISIPMWNKNEGPRQGEFKKYKMTLNNFGNIFFKPYYILEIEKDNQTFGIYFPCYELGTIEKLTGLTASLIVNE